MQIFRTVQIGPPITGVCRATPSAQLFPLKKLVSFYRHQERWASRGKHLMGGANWTALQILLNNISSFSW
jgi:hypothetical protein